MQAVYEAMLDSPTITPEYKGLAILEYFESFLLGRRLWCRQVS